MCPDFRKVSRFCPDVSRNQPETGEPKSQDSAGKFLIFLRLLCSWFLMFTTCFRLKILVSTVQFRPCPCPHPGRIKRLRLLGGSGVRQDRGDCPGFVPIFRRKGGNSAGSLSQVLFASVSDPQS